MLADKHGPRTVLDSGSRPQKPTAPPEPGDRKVLTGGAVRPRKSIAEPVSGLIATSPNQHPPSPSSSMASRDGTVKISGFNIAELPNNTASLSNIIQASTGRALAWISINLGAKTLTRCIANYLPKVAHAYAEACFVHEVGYRFKYSSSAELVERALDITGVATHYKLPDGHTPASFEIFSGTTFGRYFRTYTAMNSGKLNVVQRYTWGKYLARCDRDLLPRARKLFDTLCSLNPELEQTRSFANNIQRLQYIFAGVAFKFNPDDIVYFLGDPQKSETQEHRAKTLGFLKMAKGNLPETGRIGWYMSPKTVAHIERSLDSKNSVSE